MSATQTSYADAVKGISPKASPVSSPRLASATTITSKESSLGSPSTAPPSDPTFTAANDLSLALPETPLTSISELIPAEAEEEIAAAEHTNEKKKKKAPKIGPKVVDVYHVYRTRKEDEVDFLTSVPFPLPYAVEIEIGYDYIRKDKNGRKALSRINEALRGFDDISNNIGITFDRSSTVALFRHARDAELFLALSGQVFESSEGGWHYVPGMSAEVIVKNGVTFQSKSGYRAVFDQLRGYGEIHQIIRSKIEADDEEDEEHPSYSYSIFFRTKVASSAAVRGQQGFSRCRYNQGVGIKRKPIDGVQLEKKPRKKRKSGQSQSAYSMDVTSIGNNDNDDPDASAVSPPSFTFYEWLTISAIQNDIRPFYAWARPKITPFPVTKIDEPDWSWEALHPPPAP